MNAATIARINAEATTSKDNANVIVHIGGVDVWVRVRPDGRLYVWAEVDDPEGELIHPETECLPVKMGVCDSVVFETDERGLNAACSIVGSDGVWREPLHPGDRVAYGRPDGFTGTVVDGTAEELAERKPLPLPTVVVQWDDGGRRPEYHEDLVRITA